ncbi:MAG: hypothetical protein E6940_07200 [Clostridium septicum]|uniref:hypothetical protein n=1 Tax=Clostridium septicum TaxID=1504 RepID=UPI00083159A5|nr:hypothetical protein [Clostridium septicum]MDU1313833.1 hypothetical protein [Clostridium septicum]WLF70107.1 hypothetical protein Q6375_03670 [Clostridium septicum]
MKTALKILFFLPTIIFAILIILDLFDFTYELFKFKKTYSKLKFKYISKIETNNKLFLIYGIIIILITIFSRHIDFYSFAGLYFIETALIDSCTVFSDDFILIQKSKISYSNIESLLCQKPDLSESKKRILLIRSENKKELKLFANEKNSNFLISYLKAKNDKISINFEQL